MKPISESSFWEAIDAEVSGMYGSYSPATCNAVWKVGDHCNPEYIEEDDENENSDHLEFVTQVFVQTSNIDGLKTFLKEKIDVAIDLGYLERFFEIGATEECEYADVESFFKDIDYEAAIAILRKCWEEACQGEEEDDDDGLTDSELEELFSLLGGEEKYKEITRWASENLSEDSISKFDETVENADFNEIKKVILEIKEKYDSRFTGNESLLEEED